MTKKIQLYIDEAIRKSQNKLRTQSDIMMQIARFRVEHQDENTKDKHGPTEEDRVWDHILNNYKQWENKGVKPLYLTDRGIYRDISLIVSSKSADDFAEFILSHMTSLDCIKDVWMFNMMEPRLFSVPKKFSQNMKRFTLTLSVIPREAPFVYDAISKIKPSSDIVITYITYIYHRHGDILVSLLAGEKTIVEDFVIKYLDGMKGVIRTEIISIIRSKNLSTPDDWRDHCGQYFIIEDGKDVEDLEIYESWYKSGFE